MSQRRVKRLGETNSALLHQINATIPTGFDDQTITPATMEGTNGFVKGQYFGTAYQVAFSDVDARVWASFFIREGGDFKIIIVHVGSGANNGKEASGKVYINDEAAGGTQSWDTNGANWDLTLDNASILMIAEYGTAITIADNSHFGCFWGKDDNAGGAAGDMFVYSIMLRRQ